MFLYMHGWLICIVICLCLSGHVRPALCTTTTLTVQNYLVDHQAALCTMVHKVDPRCPRVLCVRALVHHMSMFSVNSLLKKIRSPFCTMVHNIDWWCTAWLCTFEVVHNVASTYPSGQTYSEDHHHHSVCTCLFNFGPVGGSSAETPHGHFGALILYDPGE